MTEETAWIGGQLTSQAVPPDEHRWIETRGANKSYREFRTRIRDYYRRNYPLTDAANNKSNLNPGGGTTVQAQLWFRDPQNTSNQTTSLSNAIEFLVFE